jgi:hypothetical protein
MKYTVCNTVCDVKYSRKIFLKSKNAHPTNLVVWTFFLTFNWGYFYFFAAAVWCVAAGVDGSFFVAAIAESIAA